MQENIYFITIPPLLLLHKLEKDSSLRSE